MCRFHTQTAGSTLTAQQVDNNIVRTTLQAASAVMGGTQSLHTNSRDEALALPNESSALLALRTQQIIAYESGIPDVADPLAGSYYIEHLTDTLEKETFKLASVEDYVESFEFDSRFDRRDTVKFRFDISLEIFTVACNENPNRNPAIAFVKLIIAEFQ